MTSRQEDAGQSTAWVFVNTRLDHPHVLSTHFERQSVQGPGQIVSSYPFCFLFAFSFHFFSSTLLFVSSHRLFSREPEVEQANEWKRISVRK